MTLTPCSSANSTGRDPGKEGSNDGWTLRILFGNRSTKFGERILMNPARTTPLAPLASTTSARADEKSSRESKSAQGHDFSSNPRLVSPLQCLRPRNVGEDEGDVRFDVAVIDEGLEIGPGA